MNINSSGVFADTLIFLLFTSGIFLILNCKLRYQLKVDGLSRKFRLHGGKPFEFLNKFRQSHKDKRRTAAIEKEIYSSAALLSNIAIIQTASPKGAIYIIEQIASYSEYLKQPFEHMIYYLRQNRDEEALEAFERESGTETARAFGSILIQMDKIHPSEQKENIRHLMNKLREESITREKKRNETISDIVYIPVLANVIVVFINFIYIAFYAEQKDMFLQLFNL